MADDDANQQYYNDDAINNEVRVCEVYNSEDFFTSFVQIMLAVLALASLYVKRHREVPKRKFETWFLDMSKQGFGAVYAHILNMAIAKIIAQNVRGDRSLADECAWYAINYLIDTTLGLVLSIIFLRIVDLIAKHRDWVSLRHRGVYTGPHRYWTWFAQLIVWIIVLTLVKVIVCYFMWLTSEQLAWLGELIFTPFQSNIRFELLFVMIVFPGILNVIYFWIIDSYLKASKHHADAHEHHVDFHGALPGPLPCVEPESQVSMDEDSQHYVNMDAPNNAKKSEDMRTLQAAYVAPSQQETIDSKVVVV